MTLKKLLLTIAGAVGILGTSLPWYKASLFGISVSENAFGMGALYVILAILAIICSVAVILMSVMKEKQIKNLIKIKDFSKILLCAGIALFAIAVIAFIAINNESKGFGNVSFGIWLIGLAGVAIIVIPLLKNVKQLDKVIIGQAEKVEKTSRADSKKESDKSSK